MISKYFAQVKRTIQSFDHIISDESIDEKQYDEEVGLITGELTFVDESRLDFTEVKDITQQSKLKYRYHYMDKENEMIFRYDNAKHHKEIRTFPHHKHIPGRILESQEPEIEEILIEIEPNVLEE